MAPTEWSAIARLPSRSPGGASWCPHDSVGRHVSGFRCPETDLGYFSEYPTLHPCGKGFSESSYADLQLYTHGWAGDHCLPCREPRKHELQRFACLKA